MYRNLYFTKLLIKSRIDDILLYPPHTVHFYKKPYELGFNTTY